MRSEPIIWVHADALSRTHPLFEAAPDGAPAIYVWDAQDVRRRGWSLKRCVFVLECLADMGVDIVEGDTWSVLAGRTVFTAATIDPFHCRIIEELGDRATVIESPAFVTLPDGTDMRRFFRYWNKAKRTAMQLTLEGQKE